MKELYYTDSYGDDIKVEIDETVAIMFEDVGTMVFSKEKALSLLTQIIKEIKEESEDEQNNNGTPTTGK